MEVVIQMILKYRSHAFGVETIQAHYNANRQLRERLMSMRYYSTVLRAVNPTSKKKVRIESIELLFENGAIWLKRYFRLLIEMLTPMSLP
ncbi:MAG: hypothetical protein N2484_00975 [Clostridia bacterium]|nr:hypothetical protein [Clostridia bacterium]